MNYKLQLTAEDISNDRVLLINESSEILSERQKEEAVEYNITELEDLIKRSAEEIKSIEEIVDDHPSISEEGSDPESIAAEKVSGHKHNKSQGNSPSSSPITKEARGSDTNYEELSQKESATNQH